MKTCHVLMLLGVMLLLSMGYASGSKASQQDGEEISIGEYRVIHSRILNEDRTLLVHLPRNYNGARQNYPVLYMLYGNHVSTYFAETVSVLDTLGPTGRMPECILVGIMNTDRYRDLLPLTPDGKETGIAGFTRFLAEEVFPFVEKNYRTKKFRILLGPQAGANFGLYSLFTHPDLFDAFLLNNPFRWQGGRDAIMEQAEAFFGENSRFHKFVFLTYDDTDPLAREGIEYIERFSKLAADRHPRDFSLVLNFIEKNDEFLQRLGVREGLKKLFDQYPFPENRKVEGLSDILAFYRELSGLYGFPVDPPEHVLTVQGDVLMEKGRIEEVMEILNYAMEQYPSAANSYFRMSNVLMKRGELESARDYLFQALDRIPQDNGMFRSRLENLDKRIAGSAAYQVEKAIRSAGLEEGLRRCRELKAEADGSFYFDEREFNELGYRLLGTGKRKEALQIFQIIVEFYPSSANAFDSLAEAFLKNGDRESAVRNYRKSLELDPQNRNAADMLKKLEN